MMAARLGDLVIDTVTEHTTHVLRRGTVIGATKSHYHIQWQSGCFTYVRIATLEDPAGGYQLEPRQPLEAIPHGLHRMAV